MAIIFQPSGRDKRQDEDEDLYVRIETKTELKT